MTTDRAALLRRYRRLLSDPDPAIRATARAQLGVLQRTRSDGPTAVDTDPPSPSPQRAAAAVELRRLAEARLGPLHARGDGALEGSCPYGHASRSGRCFVIFPSSDRWYCRSCRRSGDLVDWLVTFENVPLREALRRAGRTPTPTLQQASGRRLRTKVVGRG